MYWGQTPHAFWDFVSNLEDHPFAAGHFGGPPPPHGPPHPGPWGAAHFHGRPEPENSSPKEAGPSNSENSEKTPVQDQSPRTRSLGENSQEKPEEAQANAGCGPGRGHCGRGSRARPGPGGAHQHHHGGPRGRGHRGRGGFFGDSGPFHPSQGPFDLPAFLENLGSQLGINLDEALGRSKDNSDSQVDFTPRADVFDTPAEFVVQASLPGALKPDISVDYDAAESVLRLAGVVYRPDITEELHNALVVNERRREVGVFERNIKLGTRGEPAPVVDQEKISAKLADGILVVHLPKVHVERLRKRVSIETVYDEKNSKHASIDDEIDESDAMHVDSTTETGDLLEEAETEDGQHTPYGESDDGREYVQVDVK